MQKLKVNEVFGPTIQGEGSTAGKEVYFIRLAGCNLDCIYCDTPFSWNWEGTKFSHPDKYNIKNEVQEYSIQELKEELKESEAVVITGGEPLLQQEGLVELLKEIKKEWIEIETNGTITPTQEFVELVDQFNVSIKLSNTEIEESRRIKPKVIQDFQENKKAIFKFVVEKTEDVNEVIELTNKYNLTNVYLMPKGANREELMKNVPQVKQWCKDCGFKYSPRLQVLLFNTKRKV